ncbi:hypothetical protein [Argonema antarcticum]|uniref:hypothetical protein n=1 Tax=Argonema antarcticum TaxID=2942763 RepID=UPI002013BC85|nr:hypothetical protein [Argonema antarcticum]MCL1472050.1 hypothetical protein [Argonema antarcticum A004/B2]
MYQNKCEADNRTNTLVPYTNTPLVELGDFKSDSLALMPETESREAGDEEIKPDSLEEELTPGTLAILARIETFDEYFHCCGRW